MIEALTFGAIPVVDETYKTDNGVGAKGCVDPASAWRNIAADTFVFVDDWPQAARDADCERRVRC